MKIIRLEGNCPLDEMTLIAPRLLIEIEYVLFWWQY